MLHVNHLHFQYHPRQKVVLQDINFRIKKGEVVALVGNSGCGKTTLAKILVGLLPLQQGAYQLNGKMVSQVSSKERKKFLQTQIQYIFQNASESLHPAKTIKKIFTESLQCNQKITKRKDETDFLKLLNNVDMNASDLSKFPRDFSGGQCQRIAIARALLVKPQVLIADEPISSSDVTTQAKLLQLFKQIIKANKLSMLFITHDIFVARYIADWIIVMKDGQIIEQDKTEIIFSQPKENFTKQILHFSKGE